MHVVYDWDDVTHSESETDPSSSLVSLCTSFASRVKIVGKTSSASRIGAEIYDHKMSISYRTTSISQVTTELGSGITWKPKISLTHCFDWKKRWPGDKFVKRITSSTRLVVLSTRFLHPNPAEGNKHSIQCVLNTLYAYTVWCDVCWFVSCVSRRICDQLLVQVYIMSMMDRPVGRTYLSIFVVLFIVTLCHKPVLAQFDDFRCKCICPSPQIVSTNESVIHSNVTKPDRSVYIGNVSPMQCNCDGVVLPQLTSEVQGKAKEFCPRCECKYESRNQTTIKWVVTMLIALILCLTAYMLFLNTFDPLFHKSKWYYVLNGTWI